MKKLIALFLITIGTLLILDNLDLVDIRQIYDYFWPAVLILFGLSLLVRNRQVQIIGLILLTIGVLTLLDELGYLRLTFDQIMMYFWPGLLILLGLNLLISKQSSPARVRTENVRRNTSNQKEYNGFLNSVNEKVENTNFEQCSVNGVLASVDMDFSGIVFEKEHVTIEVNSVLASVSLKLPKGVRVEMAGSPVLGEVNNRCEKNIITNQSIKIHYTCILASIEVYQ